MTRNCEAHGCDTPTTERMDSDWYCREHYVAATRAAPTGMYAPVSTSEDSSGLHAHRDNGRVVVTVGPVGPGSPAWITNAFHDGTTAPIDTESRPNTDEPESADTC